MDSIDVLRIVSVTAWLLPASLFLKPAWRVIRQKAYRLDALWTVCLLGIVNRVMFTSGWPGRELSYGAAIALALILFAVTVRYQSDATE